VRATAVAGRTINTDLNGDVQYGEDEQSSRSPARLAFAFRGARRTDKQNTVFVSPRQPLFFRFYPFRPDDGLKNENKRATTNKSALASRTK